MRIVLLGRNGQVGWELQRALAPLGELVALDRGGGRADDRCGDLGQPELLAATVRGLRPDVIVNAAAYTAVDRAESEPGRAAAINAGAVRTLAEACREQGAAMLHLSTDYVFDGSKDSPWTPDDAAMPLSVYGKTKLEGEIALREALEEHLVLRTSWVFGEQGNNFVRTMLRLAGERDRLRVVADQIGGPTWSGHLADALLTLAARYRDEGGLPWGTGHFAGQPFVSWHAFAEAIFGEAAKQGLIDRLPVVEAITTAEYPTPARRPANSCLDMTATTARWGLKIPDWRNGLRHVLSCQAARQNPHQ